MGKLNRGLNSMVSTILPRVTSMAPVGSRTAAAARF